MSKKLSLSSQLGSLLAADSRHQSPSTVEAVLKTLGPGPRRRFVVVGAQYSPDPQQAVRVLIFSRIGPYLWKAADVWLTPEAYAELLARLRAICEVAVGLCDAMYATAARYVWATVRDELHVWHRRRLVARFSAQYAVLRNRAGLIWSRYPVTAFKSCRGYVSATWYKRGVALERSLGRKLVVASATESMALIDPTYDGIDLMGDASWVGDLARAISNATCLPLKLDEGL